MIHDHVQRKYELQFDQMYPESMIELYLNSFTPNDNQNMLLKPINKVK